MGTSELREQTRRSFLANAIEALNRSLDYEQTLAALAWIAVPAIADWCAVDMLDGDQLQRLAIAHRDPAKLELAKEIERRFPRDPNATTGVAKVLKTGEPQLVGDITPEVIDAGPGSPELKQLLRDLGLRSCICVPLRRQGRTIGTISLLTAESGRRYDEHDLALAVALADRAAVAVENARLFRELERAHARTAAERDRFVQLIEASPVAIALMRGPELVFEVTNAPFEQTFGGRKLRGQPQKVLDPSGETARLLHEVMREGQRVHLHEHPLSYDFDGSGTERTRYFDVDFAPLRDAEGRIDGVVSFSLDVTEQVRVRNRLEEARQQAELANRAKDEFLAMLGHELRNPLAPILTALELMELRDTRAFERERTVIARQVRHVVRLVDDLLDISRITRGAVELHREDLDVADAIAKAIEMASPLLEERGHELVTNVPGDLLVNADPVRLAQVISNLVTNAAKYTERGGKVTISADREGDRIAIRVRDTGMGIAPEALPNVFDTFYQGRQSIDRAQGGLGLGLAIVRSLVEAHGGQVAAYSEGRGTGSEFVVWLPMVDPARARAGRRMAGDGVQLRTEKILVVDDNLDALAMLADALEQRGFQTLRAHDAPSALALAAHSHPQLALVDIGLPVMDGYELGRRLRELDGLADLQLVAVTGYGQPSDVARSRAAGFAEHLVKPISLETVHATIDRLTAERRPSRAPPS